MPDNSDRRQTEKIGAAQRRAEITRVTRMDIRPQETRSRYSTGASIPTTPANMISNWAANASGNDQGGSAPADRPNDKPARRPRKDR